MLPVQIFLPEMDLHMLTLNTHEVMAGSNTLLLYHETQASHMECSHC